MTATTASPMTASADRSLPRRLRREAAHAALLLAGSAVAYGVVLGLREVAPWSTWWPLVTGALVVGVVAARTPYPSTTVLHGGRLALAHPLHAATVVAVVCLPWLGDWALTGIRLGTEAAVRGLLETTVSAGGSLGSGALDVLRGLLGQAGGSR